MEQRRHHGVSPRLARRARRLAPGWSDEETSAQSRSVRASCIRRRAEDPTTARTPHQSKSAVRVDLDDICFGSGLGRDTASWCVYVCYIIFPRTLSRAVFLCLYYHLLHISSKRLSLHISVLLVIFHLYLLLLSEPKPSQRSPLSLSLSLFSGVRG